MDTLLAATTNKIEREWPPSLNVPFGREFFHGTMEVAINTYKTVRWICADKPKDLSRRVEYSLSVPPLNRTILDSLFNVVFMLEDLSSRCSWFCKSGWREEKERLNRYQAQYSGLPDWKKWLDMYVTQIEMGKKLFGITPQEEATPSIIKFWPNPGKMPRYGISGADPLPIAREFLAYMNDWFYRDLSAQSHLSLPGLTMRAAGLIKLARKDEDVEEALSKVKSDQVSTTLTLLLALVSEIDSYFNFGLAERAIYLWTVINAYSLATREVYYKRYNQLLSSG